MDSMKNLLEPNCEGFNPIFNLYNQINHAQTLQQNRLHDSDQNNDFVQDFLNGISDSHAPATFGMQSLIDEINNTSVFSQKLKKTNTNQILSTNDWLNEFKMETFSTNRNEEFNFKTLNQANHHSDSNLNSEDWSNEFSNNQKHIAIIENKYDLTPSAWLSEFENQNSLLCNSNVSQNILAENLADEFLSSEADDFFKMMKDEWCNIDLQHPWDTDFEHFKTDDLYKDYKFEEDNPLLNEYDVLNEGLKRLKDGDIANAVLYFEAAVKQMPDDSQAWMYLGSTQADNEMETNAIAALNKCLELDPTNLTALMSLAVSYTNEMMPLKACESLKRWLLSNPLYKNLCIDTDLGDASVLKSHANLRDVFISAVQHNSTNMDADLQIGLGVLFNLSGDYGRAVDCFKAALQVRPEDNLLWNKLGATLANGHRSEEAIEAYRRSLAISSGHVRTRYNLGIACINLQAYRESMDHFISALELQRNSRGPNLASGLMSDNIWSSLKMATTLYGRIDLIAACNDRDLDSLRAEFNFKTEDL